MFLILCIPIIQGPTKCVNWNFKLYMDSVSDAMNSVSPKYCHAINLANLSTRTISGNYMAPIFFCKQLYCQRKFTNTKGVKITCSNFPNLRAAQLKQFTLTAT